MTDIFDFTDFREYLRTYYKEKKKENKHFSYQLLTQKAGFSNRGFLFNIMKGEKKLTKTHCFQLSQALNHKKKESAYFETLVAYAQAKNEQERTYYLEQIQQSRTIKKVTLQLIEKEQYEYLSKWYHSAVRSIIDMYKIDNSFEKISQMIFPPITVDQVKKSIELLERLQIIKRDRNGIYYCTGKNIEVSENISRNAVNRFHIECTELAKQALIFHSSKLPICSSLTIGISEKTVNVIKEETTHFRKKIIDYANLDEEADQVFQYQLIMFPLTRNEGTLKR